mmetsp:Transcript_29100/g.73921  ORF Transcript_29100/g.73921 Transcript_29100/m.73921 type:complete len:376 (-) Transcript_29100:180-1307(-)
MSNRFRHNIEAGAVDFCIPRALQVPPARSQPRDDDDDLEIGWACAASRMGTYPKHRKEDFEFRLNPPVPVDELVRVLRLSEETARDEELERQALAHVMHLSQQAAVAAVTFDQRLPACTQHSAVAQASCVADSAAGQRVAVAAAAAASGCCCISAKDAQATSSSSTLPWTKDQVPGRPHDGFCSKVNDVACARKGLQAVPGAAPDDDPFGDEGLAVAIDKLSTSRGSPSGQDSAWADHIDQELAEEIQMHDALKISAELADEICAEEVGVQDAVQAVEEAEHLLADHEAEVRRALRALHPKAYDIENPARCAVERCDAESCASGDSEWVDGLDSWWAAEEQLVQELEPEPMGCSLVTQGEDEEDADWLLVGAPTM